MPTNVSQVREEVCLRPDSCDKYPNGQKVTTGKYAGKCYSVTLSVLSPVEVTLKATLTEWGEPIDAGEIEVG